MHRLVVPRIGWFNTSENYISCSLMFEKEVRVFIVSIVYSIFLTRARNGVCRCVGYCAISHQRSYIKIKILRGKNPTEMHTVLWVKFVVSSQWTAVQFLVGLIVFVVLSEHRQWPKTRKAENINRWKKCEACGRCSWRRLSCNMWKTF